MNTTATHAVRSKNLAVVRTNPAVLFERIVLNPAAGSCMQPLGLSKEPAEKQNGQNHNYRDDDDLY